MADRYFPDERAEIAPLLVVSELQRPLQFYVERLGAAVLMRDKPGISLVGPTDRNHPTGEVVLHVNACHQMYEALVERGVRFLGPPNEPPWGW